jgi:hypothetical protein
MAGHRLRFCIALLALITLVTAQTPVPQNTSTPRAIVRQVHEFLQSHLVEGERCWIAPDPHGNETKCFHYHFYRPSLTKYSAAQWLWDSGSHMISWSQLNVSNSIEDLRTMLYMQRANGFIPETTFWANQSLGQDADNLLFYGNTETTQITQMPVLAFSLRAIWNHTHNVSLLEEFVPKLVRYWRWWKDTRVLSESGLVSILHGWESGLDASPMYDEAYNVSSNPTFLGMYAHFVTVMASYNLLYGWNMTRILERPHALDILNISYLDAWFYVEDIGLNAVYAAGWGILSDLAKEFNETLAQECAQEEVLFTNRIVQFGWSSEVNRFVSRWRQVDGSWSPTSAETVQSVLPLLLRHLPRELASTILTTQVTNVSKFWLPYPIPTTSASDPAFVPQESVDLMWRGPTWGFTNWMVMEGLQVQGFLPELDTLMDRWTKLVEKSGIFEMYNPITGAPNGVEGLGMSCLIVDWLFRLGRV